MSSVPGQGTKNPQPQGRQLSPSSTAREPHAPQQRHSAAKINKQIIQRRNKTEISELLKAKLQFQNF